MVMSDNGIYIVLSAATAKMLEMEVIANNLANISTSGFKADRVDFKELLQQETITANDQTPNNGSEDNAFVLGASYTKTDEQGSLSITDNPLDIALDGKGFFKVLTPGGVRYTRGGHFQANATGQLVTSVGHSLLDQVGNPISLQGAKMSVSQDGIITDDSGTEIAKLAVVQLESPKGLRKEGNSYFVPNDPQNTKELPIPSTRVVQGTIEDSNVNATLELTKMIEVSRTFENLMRMLEQYRNMDRTSAKDIG